MERITQEQIDAFKKYQDTKNSLANWLLEFITTYSSFHDNMFTFWGPDWGRAEFISIDETVVIGCWKFGAGGEKEPCRLGMPGRFIHYEAETAAKGFIRWQRVKQDALATKRALTKLQEETSAVANKWSELRDLLHELEEDPLFGI
jgi:hypothetical protein